MAFVAAIVAAAALDDAQIRALVAYVRGFCHGRQASP